MVRLCRIVEVMCSIMRLQLCVVLTLLCSVVLQSQTDCDLCLRQVSEHRVNTSCRLLYDLKVACAYALVANASYSEAAGNHSSSRVYSGERNSAIEVTMRDPDEWSTNSDTVVTLGVFLQGSCWRFIRRDGFELQTVWVPFFFQQSTSFLLQCLNCVPNVQL